MNLRKLVILLFVFVHYSCAEDAFKTNKARTQVSTNERAGATGSMPSQRTLIEPPVDFLFLWDNSSSQVYINPRTKAALNRLIQTVDDRFDYHILMAPLLANGNDHAFFISKDSTVPGGGIPKVSKDDAGNKLSQFPTNNTNREDGLQRISSMLKSNISNGIFRKDAYTIIVMMSNEDDNSYISGQDNAFDRGNYLQEEVNKILCLRGNYSGTCSPGPSIDSLMMRMISIVARDDQTCRNSSISRYRLNRLYIETSSRIYTEPYTDNRQRPTDQDIYINDKHGGNPSSFSLYDSYDICKEEYDNIFDGINSTIQLVLIRHVYDHWPVASTSQGIDPDTIKVTKVVGNQSFSFSEVPDGITITRDNSGKNDVDQNGNRVHGYRYVGNVNNQNTRFLPSPGEPINGHAIELFGEAKVTFPEYIVTEVLAPQEFFGYVSLPSKPVESSIELKINGQLIPKNSTNGWQLKKSGGQAQFIRDFNIKIKSPSDRTPETPASNKTGYFLEVFGSSIYSNGDRIDVLYDPAS